VVIARVVDIKLVLAREVVVMGFVADPMPLRAVGAAVLEDLDGAGGSIDLPPPAIPVHMLTSSPSTSPMLPHGGRLTHFLKAWEEMGSDQWTLRMLEEGYSPQFLDHPPPLTTNPWRYEICTHGNHAIVPHIQEMLDKGAIEMVQHPSSPGLFCHMFTRPKKTGGTRPIINLKPLNKHLDIPTFKMQTVEELKLQVRHHDWGASLDLKDAYFHVPIKESFRKFLRFVVQGRVYQFRALPFGLATAPRVFTKLINQVAKRLHREGIRFHFYLDDWLILGQSKEQVQAHVHRVVQLCQELGLVINMEKSELIPSQCFTYIGVHFNTVTNKCYVPEKRILETLGRVECLLNKGSAPAKEVLQVLGHLAAAEKLTQTGRIHTRGLQRDLYHCWRYPQSQYRTTVVLSSQAVEDLQWWLQSGTMHQGVDLGKFIPQVQLFTDASLLQWGACLLSGEAVSRDWGPDWVHKSINVLELQAVLQAVQHFQEQLSGKKVLIVCDNTTAVYYINKQGGTRNPALLQLTRQLLRWAEQYQVSLRARHIPGRLNVLADGLSRTNQILPTEWSLNPSILHRLWQVWHQPQVDLFATRHNHKLSVYVSPCPDPQAWAVDALNIPWTGLDAYAYPPTTLIPQVLAKVQEDQCRMILIAPYWPSRAWFPVLLDLLVDHPLELPLSRTMLKQPHNKHFHLQPARLLLHAWKLSGVASEARDFRRKCQGGLLEVQKELPL
jgi:hypothetical protein